MSRARNIADRGYIKPYGKNLVRNGAMNIWQRGSTAAAVVNTGFQADGWQMGFVSGASANVYRQTSVASNDREFNYYWEYDVTVADATVAAGDYTDLSQKIEGINTIGLMLGKPSAKTVTLSFWHAHTLTGTYSVAFRNNALNRSYIAEYTQAVSNTFEKSTITITGDTTGTWEYAAGIIGLRVSFNLACGSTFSTSTLNAWQTGNFIASSNQVNSNGSLSNFCRIANIQLELGSIATDFDYLTIENDLIRNQRYYEKNYLSTTKPADNVPAESYLGSSLNSTTCYVPVTFKVPKISDTYSVSFFRGANGTTAGDWAYYNSGWTDCVPTTNLLRSTGMRLILTDSGMTIGNSYLTDGGWVVKDEL